MSPKSKKKYKDFEEYEKEIEKQEIFQRDKKHYESFKKGFRRKYKKL